MSYPTTLLIAILAIASFASSALSDALQLDWQAVGAGQWWRLWTGHVTHYGLSHLFWDWLMFVVLSSACERRHPRFYAGILAAMMLGVSLAVGAFCTGIEVYRGLSGIDSGLFVWFVLDRSRDAWRARNLESSIDQRWIAFAWIIPLVGLIGKLIYEAVSGNTLFVNSDTFRPLVEAHLAGAVLGVISWKLAANDSIEPSPP